MSKFFIEHPVLANVLAIVLVLLGAVSLFRLPVSEYPNVVPPTVIASLTGVVSAPPPTSQRRKSPSVKTPCTCC